MIPDSKNRGENLSYKLSPKFSSDGKSHITENETPVEGESTTDRLEVESNPLDELSTVPEKQPIQPPTSQKISPVSDSATGVNIECESEHDSLNDPAPIRRRPTAPLQSYVEDADDDGQIFSNGQRYIFSSKTKHSFSAQEVELDFLVDEYEAGSVLEIGKEDERAINDSNSSKGSSLFSEMDNPIEVKMIEPSDEDERRLSTNSRSGFDPSLHRDVQPESQKVEGTAALTVYDYMVDKFDDEPEPEPKDEMDPFAYVYKGDDDPWKKTVSKQSCW